MLKFHSRLLEERFAQLAYTGTTKLSLWEVLNWFDKDGGRITKSFWSKEVYSEWLDYCGEDNEVPHFSVVREFSELGMTKPSTFILYLNDNYFTSSEEEDE